MKTARFLLFMIFPLLFACVHKPPEIPLHEVPSETLVGSLLQRAGSFTSLKALASVTASREGRRRIFETSAILVRDQESFRLEAYGPLGQSLAVLQWDGTRVLVELDSERRVLPPSGSGLERFLGARVEPVELCALLSGNVPESFLRVKARLLCPEQGACVLESQREDRIARVYAGAPADNGVNIDLLEMYQGKDLLYRARFSSFQPVSGYSLPGVVRIENPDKRISLTIEYAEAEVNVPLADALFRIEGEGP